MQIAVKRVYCPSCGRLRQAKEQTVNKETQILCSKCGRPLYSWNGLRWKVIKPSS